MISEIQILSTEPKIHLGSHSLICPKCQKRVTVTQEVKGKSNHIILYSCGHTEIVKQIVITETPLNNPIEINPYAFFSFSGKQLYPYQQEGVKFIEASNGRALVADEMALGKTVQALGTIKLHPEMMPFMVICKAGLKRQWIREIHEWLFCNDPSEDADDDFSKSVLPVEAPELLLKGFNAYVSSYDIWAERKGKKKSGGIEKEGGPNLQDIIIKMGIKTIILDEVQQIKNSDSKRTKVIRKICSVAKHVIELSGTPFKNNAKEYFNALNIIQPRWFPTEVGFINSWVGYEYGKNGSAKYGGIKNPETFKKYTEKFIIRRERKDVLPDLPSITRGYSYHDLGEEVEEAYGNAMKQFLDKYDEGVFEKSTSNTDLLAYLARMRHLTGLSKITGCIDFLVEFLNSCDRKIVVFCHHIDVSTILFNKCKELCANLSIAAPITLYDCDGEQKDNNLQQFKNSDARIMIASTLADGEGLNMQFCADCIILEREWNPANEEQAEARFPRPGQLADKINANYLVAVGTIDEYFAEIVERKRRIFKSTMDGKVINAVDWNQQGLMKELADLLASKGRRKWSF